MATLHLISRENDVDRALAAAAGEDVIALLPTAKPEATTQPSDPRIRIISNQPGAWVNHWSDLVTMTLDCDRVISW